MKPNEYSQKNLRIPVIESIHTGTIELWMDACASIFGLAPIEREDAEKDYSVAAWHVHPVTIVNSKYKGMVARHSPWHVEESGGQIHVHRYRYGRASVETTGLPVSCETDAITLLDYSRPFTSLHTENDCESFFVPHEAINYRPSDALHAPVYGANSTLGRLLGREMDHLLNSLKAGATTILQDDIQRFLGCVEVAMSPNRASTSARMRARNSLKIAVQQFIEERLDKPELNVTLILENFGVSRASLYRMFELEDGVRNYISSRRLYRAVTELADAPLVRGKVHEVAQRWGFSTDSNFNRMVKREFGVTPGGLFQMPISSPKPYNYFSSVHELMSRAAQSAKTIA
jgi:AraC-like DNA-binding protein